MRALSWLCAIVVLVGGDVRPLEETLPEYLLLYPDNDLNGVVDRDRPEFVLVVTRGTTTVHSVIGGAERTLIYYDDGFRHHWIAFDQAEQDPPGVLVLVDFNGNGPPAPPPHRRHAANPPLCNGCVIYDLDLDRDGHGAGKPFVWHPGEPISSLWIRWNPDDKDCNDADRNVHQLRSDIAPDRGDGCPYGGAVTVCVGDGVFGDNPYGGISLSDSMVVRYFDQFGCAYVNAAECDRVP